MSTPCTFILEVPPEMELQDKALRKLTIKTFKDEIKAEIKEIRKEVEELKLSVKFVSASHDDFKTRLGKIDDEISLSAGRRTE